MFEPGKTLLQAAGVDASECDLDISPNDMARWEWVPVPPLRWTHSGIDRRMIFAHDEREGRSVYETTDNLWRGVTTTRDITPLEVVYFGGKLWSLSNRRLAALKMYQALSGDKVIWVRCFLRNEQHPRFDKNLLRP